MYGVTARAVAHRTKESAIRLALGAGPWAVARQLVAYTLSGAGVGVAAGLFGAVLATRALTPLLFGVSATDPATYVGIVALLVAIGVAASVGPARRAGRVPLAAVLKGDG
jgi:ABC-type antimicrobial peptide transport system permease subunit